MKLAFVSTYDPQDRSLWAGTTYHMGRALQRQGIDAQFIGPLRERFAMPFKAVQLAYQKLRGEKFERSREPLVLRGWARQVEHQLQGLDVDVVLSSGSFAIAHLRTSLPVVMWTDATYDRLIDEYIWEPPPTARTRRMGRMMDLAAQQNCALVIYSSDWAARSAIEEYGTDPAKVKVVPYGANVAVNHSADEIRALAEQRGVEECRLLFVGTGWERKGGDIAVEVARLMNDAGMRTQLTLVGRIPSHVTLPAFAKPAGFIDKGTESGREQFDQMFASSHFLIHPARAEASAIVLCEAGAYGVPVLSTRVGGTPTIIRAGVNGMLFPPENPQAIATGALELLRDRNRYQQLCVDSFHEHRTRLNWDAAANRVKGYLEQILEPRANR